VRVAIVTETWLPSVDGVVTRLVHTVEHLAAGGHDILVLAPTAGPAMRGVTQLTLPGLALPLIDVRRRVAVPTRQPLQAAVATFATDVVHVVNPVAMGAGAVRLLAPRYP
jgi:phosphatidylinositol alpha 1,6-mannosyltransferase